VLIDLEREHIRQFNAQDGSHICQHAFCLYKQLHSQVLVCLGRSTRRPGVEYANVLALHLFKRNAGPEKPCRTWQKLYEKLGFRTLVGGVLYRAGGHLDLCHESIRGKRKRPATQAKLCDRVLRQGIEPSLLLGKQCGDTRIYCFEKRCPILAQHSRRTRCQDGIQASLHVS
jgi:hypothetical protein